MHLTSHRPPAAISLIAAGLLLAACTNVGSGSPAASTGGALELTVSDTAAGDALAGANGLTLYILTSDSDGTSTCTSGECASNWPALEGEGAAVEAGSGISGTWGTATWPDGTKQVTHNGQPLYYYVGDSVAGDATGEGVGGVWFIAPVDATQGGPQAGQGSAKPSESSAEPSDDGGYNY